MNLHSRSVKTTTNGSRLETNGFVSRTQAKTTTDVTMSSESDDDEDTKVEESNEWSSVWNSAVSFPQPTDQLLRYSRYPVG